MAGGSSRFLLLWLRISEYFAVTLLLLHLVYPERWDEWVAESRILKLNEANLQRKKELKGSVLFFSFLFLFFFFSFHSSSLSF